MKLIKSTVLCLLAAFLLPALTQAKPGKGPRQLDTDGNRVITKAEAEAAGATRLLERFDTIDSNGDGELTREEMMNHRKQFADKHRGKLRDADSDQNGAISYDEAADAGLEKMVEHFDRIDGNGDGEIDRQEMRELRTVMRQQGKGRGPGGV